MTKQEICSTYLIMKTFNVKEAGTILDISKAKIQRWVEDGLIIPYKDSEGRGSYREYSERNLVEMLLVKTLFDDGITTNLIYNAMSAIRGADEGLSKLKTPCPVLRTIGPGHEEDMPPRREDFLIFDDAGRWVYFSRDPGSVNIELDPLRKTHYIVNLTRFCIETALLIDFPKGG